jgi:hypothetical protein
VGDPDVLALVLEIAVLRRHCLLTHVILDQFAHL